MTAADVVLAHYGGVPEVATLGLPVVLFTAFMLMERRARRRERERAAVHEQSPPGNASRSAGGNA